MVERLLSLASRVATAPARTDLLRQETVRGLWRELDSNTQQHSLRVQRLVGRLAESSPRITPQLAVVASEIALIHDIGKAHERVHHHLYTAPQETSSEALAEIRRHTHYGADRAKEAGLPELYTAVILHHHEDNDGHGYPGDGDVGDLNVQGWTRHKTVAELGEDTALIIDLIRIADSLDSIAESHYARKGRGMDIAIKEIQKGMNDGRYNKDFEEPLLKLAA